MLYFLSGFLCAIILFIIYVIWNRNEQRKIEFQLNLIIQKSSASPIKTSYFVFIPSLLNSINLIIQELLEQKKEFETAKESLKSMATSISHDFRTPLTSISGYMQLLLDDNNISQEDKIKYLNIVKNRSMSLSALVEDFYSITSIDSFDYPFVISKISLSQTLREIIANYYSELEQAYDKINIDIPSNKSMIYSDKTSLERIFSNLIKNSFIYGREKIDISLKDNAEKNTYDVSISNTLPANFKVNSTQDIFKRNYSVDWSSGSKSTGLGLSIAKTLTEKSGGQINAVIKDNTIIFSLSFPKCTAN